MVMRKEIEVDGVVYRYTVDVDGDSTKGMTQYIEVFNDEGSIGGKADSATYGRLQNQHSVSAMEGIARIIAHEIVGEFIRRTSNAAAARTAALPPHPRRARQ
jgi:hypothetical protein